MLLYVIFAQRKDSYPGENAPEAIACLDEFANDDNPAYLDGEEERARASGEYVSVRRVAITFPRKDLEALLNPVPPTISGNVATAT